MKKIIKSILIKVSRKILKKNRVKVFKVLKENGLVFQSQVAYLIPIFGVVLGYIFLGEIITDKVIIALVAIILGIYLVKKSTKRIPIKV